MKARYDVRPFVAGMVICTTTPLIAQPPHTHSLLCGVGPERNRMELLLKSHKGVITPVTEQEPNDSNATAQHLPLGFDAGEFQTIVVNATAPYQVSAKSLAIESENNGSIPLAETLPLVANQADLVEITNHEITAGATPDVDGFTFTVGPDQFMSFRFIAGTLQDHYFLLYDSTGDLIFATALDFVRFNTGSTGGTYTLLFKGWGVDGPTNPFDWTTASGSGDAGTYSLEIGFDALDSDWYSVDLEPGDIVGGMGGNTDFVPLMSFYRPNDELAVSSYGVAFYPYPEESPLPFLGVGFFSYIAEEAGRHTINMENGFGSYPLELHVYRPPIQSENESVGQKLFLDFNGVTMNMWNFTGPNEDRTLSPLSAFLDEWGLQPSDEDAVIDSIIATVEENLRDDLRALGYNGDRSSSGVHGEFDLEILNSRDHADPWGEPNVSRIVIGGSIVEGGFFFDFIGIAESIDPGNFGREETAIVLLDVLSGDPGIWGNSSLNSYSLAPGASKIDLVGRAVGNIVAHEAGHFFGCWHTQNLNGTPSIMDQGGDLPTLIGVGDDGIFGNGDDIDTDFVTDDFAFFELFFGKENTANVLSWGLATGATAPASVRDWGGYER